MNYKRKNNTYQVSKNANSSNSVSPKESAKGHGKNIGVLILCLIGVFIFKGIILSSEDNAVKTAIASPLITDMEWGVYGSSYSVDRTPSPELTAEVAKLRKEIDMLDKTNGVKLASRGDVDRDKVKPASEFAKYDFSKMFGNSEILAIMEDECAKHDKNGDKNKEFFEVIYSLALYESHFDPNVTTITKTEHSIGLLQVNTYTNAPNGIDIEKFRKNLRNPRYNLDYQLDELYDFYVLGKSKGLKGRDLACFVSKYGQRPNWSDAKTRNYIVNSIYNTYNQISKARIN